MEDEKKEISRETDLMQIFMRLSEIDMKLTSLMQQRETQLKLQQEAQIPQPQQTTNGWPAVCSVCKQNCTVPFKPYPNSTIKCRDCYKIVASYNQSMR